MKPYTMPDVEADLRAALAQGDESTIDQLGHVLDSMDTRTKPAVSPLSAALYYAEQGLRVFPIQPGTKVPFKGSNGCKGASGDPDLIRRWWEGNPAANVAIATGHLVDVVDIDGAIGQRSRCHAWEQFDSLHVLATVSTPRAGGMHIYVPASGEGNKAGLLPGIDYRGLGGYVLAAPSTTADGSYRFLQPLDLSSLERAA